jgi:hypothetical protein
MPRHQFHPPRKTFPLFIKIIAFLLCFILSFEQSGFAQVAGQLDLSHTISNAVNSFSSAAFRPPHLRYISYDKFKQSFKIILNKGDNNKAQAVEFGDSVRQPLEFFYIGLAIPNENFWVNLRPDSADRIIDDYLAETDVGKIMLEADLELKKDLARATFPATPEGKEYWEKIYNKIKQIYGYASGNVPVSINTRIWIIPGEVVICQDQNSAYIYKAGLNVSTEAAYLSNKQGNQSQNEPERIINQYSSELIQELILPKISKEVNTGKKYASLRQVYYSLILAQWFKNRFYGAGGLYPYLIDRNNLTGLTSNKRWSKNTYFKEYQKSIREKEYDLQVRVFDLFGRSIRTYSTGGVDFSGVFPGMITAQSKVISSNSFFPPLTEQTQAADIQRGTLQEPYLGRVSLAAPAQEAVTAEQQLFPVIEIKNSSLTRDDPPTETIRSWRSVIDNFSLKVLFSPLVRKPLYRIAQVLTSLPKPVLRLMFIVPIVGTLLSVFYSTVSAFAITAEVANGSIKDLIFTFRPSWQNSPDPANETLSGIGQIIGESRGLEGDKLMDFIYNQFIPEMKPILANQGISDVNIIRDGEQIKIPAKFLEGLTFDNLQGVVNSLQHHGWSPLNLEANTFSANLVSGANVPQHTGVTVIPETPTGGPGAATATVTPAPDPMATITGNPATPAVTPVSPAAPTLARTQNSQDFLIQVMGWVNHHQPLLMVIGTAAVAALLFFLGRAIYAKIRNAQSAKQQLAKETALHNNTGAGQTVLVPPEQKQAEGKVAQSRLKELYLNQGPQAPPGYPPQTPTLNSSGTQQNRKISEDELDIIIERLQSSPRKYLQRLFNSKRINIRARVRFIADELGFDIVSGQGVSLLVRNPETLSKNKEFLEGLALPVNVTNLKSSKRSFVAREVAQIIKYSQWQQLTNEEKLAVVSYLFDVYGLRSSWITRGNDWNRLLARFNLQGAQINYSLRSIDFIQQYELARFLRFGNAPRTENRLSKIKEIVEIMGLKVSQLLDRAKTPQGFPLYIAKQGADKSQPEKLPAIEVAPLDYTDAAGEPELLQETELLKGLEEAIETSITDLQIQMVLTTLINANPGQDSYERARAIVRHIHPDDFRRIRKASRSIQLFASNQLFQERFEAIALERPSDLSVSLARSLSKIHDWENLLKQPNLSAQDVSHVLECCERIIAILSLRLNQETNDSIGSIYKIMKQSYGLTQKTVIKLLGQKDLDKKLYEKSVKTLLARGHYFSDYLAFMGYLADLDIAKKYLYEDQKDSNGNGNGYSNGNGQAHKKISYSWWHKITAVPFLENNAMRNLKLLLPRLNTEDNEFTPEEYFHNLKPTRIGSSRAWMIRKPVTVFTSLILSLVSLTLFLFATPFVVSLLLFIKGFLVFFGIISIPLMHYFFAYIGTVRQRKDLKKSHSQISNLEKRWKDFAPVTRLEIPPHVPPAGLKDPSLPVQEARIEEDHAVEGSMVNGEDVGMLAELADLLEIKPVQLPQIDKELEDIFGSGRVNKLVITIMPEALMLTKSHHKISRPVRLGNRIFVGDGYFTENRNNFFIFLADLAHEQMGQWVARNRPDLNPDAHSLAKELAKVVKVAQDNSPGGIDLRRINFTVKDTPATVEKNIELSAAGELFNPGAEQEMLQINRLIKAKIIPSSERLKECLSKVPVSGQSRYIKQMNNFLAEIFMLEEEYGQPSEVSFINLLQTVVLNK